LWSRAVDAMRLVGYGRLEGDFGGGDGVDIVNYFQLG
jgi:hypothetical protein